MSSNERWFVELLHLLSELAGDGLDDERRGRLRDLLRDNPEAQAVYLEHMEMHAQLHLELGPARALSYLPHPSATPPSPGEAGGVSPRGSRLLAWPIPALAATVATAMLLGAAAWTWRSVPRPAAGRPPSASADRLSGTEGQAVAVLTRVAGAEWEATGLPTSLGSRLPPGRLKLNAGLAQVEFLSGACVVLEGPAELELVSVARAYCHLGKVTIYVPTGAHGFTLGAQGVDAVDLGTEFAMRVDERGLSEVHVVDGEVELRNTGKTPIVEEAKKLTTGRAVRFGPSQEAVEIAAAPKDFVDRSRLLQFSDARNQELYRRWRSASQALRSDPSVVVYYGFEGHEPWERTLRSDQPARPHEGLDGAIVGCLWTEGRWPGKQALEFKRISDRVRIDVPGEFDALTLMTWVRVEGLSRWFNSLILSDVWDEGVGGDVHWQLRETGEVRLGISDGRGDGTSYDSPPVLGPRDLGRWVHLVTVYDPRRKLVLHYRDGELVGQLPISGPVRLRIGPAEIGNWAPIGPNRYLIRSLNGRIDEFGVFRRVFGPDEIRSVYEAGRPES